MRQVNSTRTKLRLAVAGTGIVGRHHARAATREGHFLVAAVVDPTEDKRETVAEEIRDFSAQKPATARSIEGAVRENAIDVVVICSPTGLHVDMAREALAAGAHVLIEKPLDADLRRAREFVGEASKASAEGLVILVVSQHRLDAASVTVHQAVQAGLLGTLVSATVDLPWYRSQAYFDSATWRGTWRLDGGGAAMNQGIHSIDLMIWTVGRPIEVFAFTALRGHKRVEVEDVVVATVRFDSGALGTIHCTTGAYPGLESSFSVYGTAGSVLIANDELVDLHTRPPVQYRLPENLKEAEAVSVELRSSRTRSDQFLAGHVRQCANLARAIIEHQRPSATVEDAFLSLAVVRAIYVSAQLGRSVMLDDVLVGLYDDLIIERPEVA